MWTSIIMHMSNVLICCQISNLLIFIYLEPTKKFLSGKKLDDKLKQAMRMWFFSQPTDFCETRIFKLIPLLEQILQLTWKLCGKVILSFLFYIVIVYTYVHYLLTRCHILFPCSVLLISVYLKTFKFFKCLIVVLFV